MTWSTEYVIQSSASAWKRRLINYKTIRFKTIFQSKNTHLMSRFVHTPFQYLRMLPQSFRSFHSILATLQIDGKKRHAGTYPDIT